jgi:hypothetical protein
MAGPPNLSQHRLPSSSELAGREITIATSVGDYVVRFGAQELRAERPSGPAVTGGYDAVALRLDTYLVAVDVDSPATSGLTIALAADGGALFVEQERVPEGLPDGTVVRNRYLPGLVAGTSGELPTATSDMLGRWHQMRYSDDNFYEHIYLSSDRFCSHNLATQGTPGRADCHPVDYWRLAPDLYLTAWRERGSGAAMVLVEDLATARVTGSVLHPATDDLSVVVPIGGILTVVRTPDGADETAARAAAVGWEPSYEPSPVT